MYPIERKERLSNTKKEVQYGMMISPEADIIQIEDEDGGNGTGDFGRRFTSFQPYTGKRSKDKYRFPVGTEAFWTLARSNSSPKQPETLPGHSE